MVVLDTDGVLDLDDLPPELMEVDSTVEGANGMLAHASSIDSGAQSQLLGKSMHEIEKWAILETLQMTGGNREEAARILQIGARTLYRKLDKYREEEGHAPRSSSIDTTEDNEED
jgi:two-component system response regulator HydG